MAAANNTGNEPGVSHALTLAGQAKEFNRFHYAALYQYDKAVEFGRKAGEVLLKVKAELPHGEFGQWLEAHCDVSTRQAQRYMSAALGKPLPMRKVANATPVSLLENSKPARDWKTKCTKLVPYPLEFLNLKDGEGILIEREFGTWMDTMMILPSTTPGKFHSVWFSGSTRTGAVCSVTPSSNLLEPDHLALFVAMKFTHLQKIELQRFDAEPHATNPFAETGHE